MKVAFRFLDATGAVLAEAETDAAPDDRVLDTLERLAGAPYAFAYGCRHGLCGDCTLMVNGSPRRVCITTIREVRPRSVIVIGPEPAPADAFAAAPRVDDD